MEVVFIKKIDELTPDRLNDVYKDFAKKQIPVEYDGTNEGAQYGRYDRYCRNIHFSRV